MPQIGDLRWNSGERLCRFFPLVVILNNIGKNWKRIYADGCSDGGNIIIFVLFSKLSLTFHYCLCNNDNF